MPKDGEPRSPKQRPKLWRRLLDWMWDPAYHTRYHKVGGRTMDETETNEEKNTTPANPALTLEPGQEVWRKDSAVIFAPRVSASWVAGARARARLREADRKIFAE